METPIKPPIARKILVALEVETAKKNYNSLAKSIRQSSPKSLMFIGMMFPDFKTPKMLSNKPSSCLSDSLKFSKAEENHGLEFYFMDHQEQEKLTSQKHARPKLKAHSFPSHHLM